ncbi:MAG: tRNA (adenosine(37)-N6)-dimethylallyltransferase MiaA [Candidatus Ryanbacteria bacterium]|nr:tRNA (adenosine(37)-N6)-dimethylallyltransferase MiaA [Candidatus Ryanbacteria bacterium]
MKRTVLHPLICPPIGFGTGLIRSIFYYIIAFMARPHIIVIAGPTASGKSARAFKLARKLKGEIVSADSRQVYKGLDIGTAKPSKREQRSIPHHCIDLASPKKTLTVTEYQKAALRAIKKILAKDKTPIIVGGTGFYIDAILYDTAFPEVPPNPALRRKLEKLSAAKLFAMLKKLDPARAENIDTKNPRRLMRAIEIARTLGRVPTLTKAPRFDAKIILLNPSKATLQKNIARRTNQMLKAGLLDEVRKLVRTRIPRARILELGFEYRYPLLYLEHQISKDEMIAKINTENWRYAKRQQTWFKKAFAKANQNFQINIWELINKLV